MTTYDNTTQHARPGRRQARYAALAAAVALVPATLAEVPAQASQTARPVGAVYLASNSWHGNQIITFPRLANGTLLPPLPGVPTAGLGSGPGAIPGVATDPLGSMGSLAVDPTQMRLFAVNAGSGTVTMFKIEPGALTRLDTSAPVGRFPVSLTVDGDNVFVLNSESNTIARLTVTNGHLSLRQTCAIPAPPRPLDPPYPATAEHSEQPVATEAPGQIGISPDGKHLVVVAKEGPVLAGFPLGATAGNGEIHIYDTASDGTVTNCTSGPRTYQLPENAPNQGKFPFSFAWTQRGQLLLTEVFGTGANLPASAVQPFNLHADGSLTPISAPVGSGQIAVCWIKVSGHNVYTANYLSNDLSSYTVDRTGSLSLNNPTAGGATSGTLVTPIDMTLSSDGQFVYQISPGNGTVVPFAITNSTGAITQLPAVSDGLGAGTGQQGIAAVDFG
jgi:6-phosphogluconolactonase (cycloisomerase 2 family)